MTGFTSMGIGCCKPIRHESNITIIHSLTSSGFPPYGLTGLITITTHRPSSAHSAASTAADIQPLHKSYTCQGVCASLFNAHTAKSCLLFFDIDTAEISPATATLGPSGSWNSCATCPSWGMTMTPHQSKPCNRLVQCNYIHNSHPTSSLRNLNACKCLCSS